ncbi:MAG TPA: lysophospholipid acyltransferase family protein [Nevskiaceae bacterium]|nr:lysophospholipid acyltransferase family protein [Nevskiaceae bacterium]
MREALQRLYGALALLVFGLLIFLLVCPLVIALPTLASRRAAGRLGVRLALLGMGVRLRVEGVGRLPPQPCIVVANHASYLDGLVLTAALPARFSFVVQNRVRSWPYVGLTLSRMGVIWVDRWNARAGARDARGLLKRAEAGESLAIFAEGTFEDAPGLLRFHNGAFLIASRVAHPVVPVVLHGTRRLYGGGRRLPRWSALRIEVLDPLPASTDAAALRDAARAAILARCGEPDALAAN